MLNVSFRLFFGGLIFSFVFVLNKVFVTFVRKWKKAEIRKREKINEKRKEGRQNNKINLKIETTVLSLMTY